MTGAAAPARGVTPALLRKGAAIVQDMAVAVAESVAESYLADIGLARAGNSCSRVLFRRILHEAGYLAVHAGWHFTTFLGSS